VAGDPLEEPPDGVERLVHVGRDRVVPAQQRTTRLVQFQRPIDGEGLAQHPAQSDHGGVLLGSATAADVGVTAGEPHLDDVVAQEFGIQPGHGVAAVVVELAPGGLLEPGPPFVEGQRVPHVVDDRVVPKMREQHRSEAAVRLHRVPQSQEMNPAGPLPGPERRGRRPVLGDRPVQVPRAGEPFVEVGVEIRRQVTAMQQPGQSPDREGPAAEAEQEDPVVRAFVQLGQFPVQRPDQHRETMTERQPTHPVDPRLGREPRRRRRWGGPQRPYVGKL
jgi:hypothetical protein